MGVGRRRQRQKHRERDRRRKETSLPRSSLVNAWIFLAASRSMGEGPLSFQEHGQLIAPPLSEHSPSRLSSENSERLRENSKKARVLRPQFLQKHRVVLRMCFHAPPWCGRQG